MYRFALLSSFVCMIAFIIIYSVIDTKAKEELGTSLAPRLDNATSFHSKHRWPLAHHPRAAVAQPATRPIVPATLDDLSPSFFSGTGDCSAGDGWITRG
jgi:hypothetical protein